MSRPAAARSFLAEAPTLAHAVRLRARAHPDRPAIGEPLGTGRTLTYAELWDRVERLSRRLAATAPPARDARFAVIALPNTTDYVVAFLACLASGVVAVTLYPPTMATTRATRAFAMRLAGVVDDCSPYAIVGETDFLSTHDDLIPGGMLRLSLDESGPAEAEPAVPEVTRDDLAMLQYTSGSTSSPKGVRLTHRNLLENVESIAQTMATTDGEAIVTWLPLYHDMGLIGAVLHPLWAGMTILLSTPTSFVRSPGDWLRLASEHRASVLMAPNFAYDLCVRRGTPASGERLDLSSVRFALNGAEPVRPRTVAAFAEVFGRHGFPATAMTPAYGLAENTVAVSFAHTPAPPAVFWARRGQLLRGRFEPADAEGADRVALVGCGTDVPGVRTAIVDPDRAVELPDGRVGEVWVSGSSVAGGYHHRPAETSERFGARLHGDDGSWLRTGDRGVRVEGQLCLCGRIKDLIIQNGANHDPADIEATAVSVDPAVAETAAAFTVESEAGPDRVVLVQEVGRIDASSETTTLLSAIRSSVAEGHGLHLHTVSLVSRGQLPKTTSGKIQRSRARALWLGGRLNVLASA